MASIDIDKETLGNILKARSGLTVPVNQRPYAWESEHVKLFLQDITAAMNQSADEYFVGSVIVIRQGPKIEVYDGQQRLATTMILAAAIRDYFQSKGDHASAAAVTPDFLEKQHRESHELEPRFRLGAADSNFFENYILHPVGNAGRAAAAPDPRKESHTKIVAAAKLAKSHVRDMAKPLPQADGIKLLHRLLTYIEESVRVIWVEVGDQPTAFRIFETMNDRGLKLSAADLLKNYLCSLSGDQEDTVIEKWRGMSASLETLGQDDGDIVEFIRYYWIVKHGHIRTNDLFSKMKLQVSTKPASVEWSTNLEIGASQYVAILTSSNEAWLRYDPVVRQSIETLRAVLGVSAIRPLLLAVHNNFSRAEQTKVWQLAVNWSVRCLISGIPSGTLEGYYNRNAKGVTDGVIKNTSDLLKSMQLIPDDERFKSACSRANVSNPTLSRYYLRTLELAKGGSAEPQLVVNSDQTVVTLEHILPQNPEFKDWGHIPQEMWRPLCYRLGNQALLTRSENGKSGNVGYLEKQPTLAGSEFELTKVASNYLYWDSSTIDTRQDELAALAVKAWPLRIR